MGVGSKRGLAARPVLAAGVVGLVAAAVYLSSLNGSFQFDDYHIVRDNTALRSWATLSAAGPVTRRLTHLTFWLNLRCHDIDWMPGWHGVQVMLHAVCAILVTCIARHVAREADVTAWWFGPLAGLVFAAHPLASEAVNYITARFVLMSTLFSMLCVVCTAAMCKTRRGTARLAWLLGAMVCVVLAALSKEVGAIFAPGAAVLYLVCFAAQWRRLPPIYRRGLVLLGAGVACALVAWSVWGGPAERLAAVMGLGAGPRRGDTSLAAVLAQRIMAQSIVFWRYAWMAAVPAAAWQSVDHYVPIRPYSLREPLVLLSLAGLALWITAGFLLRRRLPAVSFGLLGFALTLSPHFVLVNYELMVEYRCYLPVAFAAIAVAGLLARLALLRVAVGRVVAVCLIALVAWNVRAVQQRNAAWRTPLALWQDAVAKSPQKGRTWNALAWVYATDPAHFNPELALRLAEYSLDPDHVDPGPPNPHMLDMLAEAHFVNGDRATAIRIIDAVLRMVERTELYGFFAPRRRHFEQDEVPDWPIVEPAEAGWNEQPWCKSLDTSPKKR